jgi:hypothetical protein
VWQIAGIVVVIGAIAVLAAPWLMRRRPPADAVAGTLLITGVSPRPDATGEQWVTVTGVINGPSVDEHVVYQRYAVDVDNWPRAGELIPVVYSSKNPDNWRPAPPEAAG